MTIGGTLHLDYEIATVDIAAHNVHDALTQRRYLGILIELQKLHVFDFIVRVFENVIKKRY
jgi:hypothetical protein